MIKVRGNVTVMPSGGIATQYFTFSGKKGWAAHSLDALKWGRKCLDREIRRVEKELAKDAGKP